MRWLRSKLQLGARLGLFVLALQTVLSFGHVHAPGRTTIPTQTMGAIGFGAVLLSAGAPGHDQDGLSETDCPICALIRLMSGSAPSVAPVLPLPADAGSVGPSVSAEAIPALLPHALFQARAPPLV